MEQTYSDGSVAQPQPDAFKLRKSVVNLGNAYMRLAAPDRRKVLCLLDNFLLGKAGPASTWDRWSKDEMKSCYLKLQPISQKMANDLRRWASELLKTGRHDRFAVCVLKDELQEREWTGITSVRP